MRGKWNFKPGQVLKRFIGKDGREVVLRIPTMKDLGHLLKLVNSLVEEDTYINQNKKLTKKEERTWLVGLLADIKKGEEVHVVGEVEGRVIGGASIHYRKHSRNSHVAELGVSIIKEYRGLGIGNEMMRLMIELGRKAGFKMLRLSVFPDNKIAYNLYRKMGFKEVARIPKMLLHRGKYADEVVMMKELR